MIYLRSLGITLLLSCIFYNDNLAQILPQNGDTLNYRIVPFAIILEKKYKDYTLEIASGTYTDVTLFEKNILLTSHSIQSQWVEEVPEWGQDYTWRVVCTRKKKRSKITSPLYHFRTGSEIYTDTSKFRMRIIDSATYYKDMMVVLDYAPVMYDMKGKLVWYIPDIKGIIGVGRGLRDLKPTSTGTFTALNDFGAFEFDYDGKVLWQAPPQPAISDDTSAHYHHEFTKLENGNYMAAGLEYITLRVPDDADTTHYNTDFTITRKNGWFYKKIDCPYLVEYSPSGQIIWSWKLSEHFDEREFFIRRHPNGTYNSMPHLNSFHFDEKNKYIYASLRNCDRVIKIKYPEGQITAQYGLYLDKDGKQTGEKLFHAQHCVKVTPNGDILLFDNNTIRERGVNSYIDRFAQPDDSTQNLRIVWQYSCNIDTNALSFALAGGGISLLPDNSLLVGMGTSGRCFIISPEKKILWNAIPEIKTETGIWTVLTVYRNYPILNIKDILLKNKLFNTFDNKK